MDMQAIFNILVTFVGALSGWIFKSMQDNIKTSYDKIQAMEVTMAGKYVTTDYLDKQIHAVFDTLRRIEDKLDKKEDKT